MTARSSAASSSVGSSCVVGAAPPGSAVRSSSTACRKLSPSRRITQSITEPPAWHAPRQCQRFFAGVITSEGFVSRLAELRQQRGLTQAELGTAVGVSQRVIAYYETESEQPPGALLADLAKTLRVSADVLLGLKPVKDGTSPNTARLLKRLKKV